MSGDTLVWCTYVAGKPSALPSKLSPRVNTKQMNIPLDPYAIIHVSLYLYVCCVSLCYYLCVLILMCECVLMLLCVCPYTYMRVSLCYYVCVLMLSCVCPYDFTPGVHFLNFHPLGRKFEVQRHRGVWCFACGWQGDIAGV